MSFFKDIKYFKPNEVLSPTGVKQLERGNLLLSPRALKKLDDFRAFLDVPLYCNTGRLHYRGYRSALENGLYKANAFAKEYENIKEVLKTYKATKQIELLDQKVKKFTKGAGFSRHVQGLAFDLHSKKIPITQLFFKALAFEWSAVGYYPSRGFIHVDDRPLIAKEDNKLYKIVWNGEKQGKVITFTGEFNDDVLKQLKENIL